MRRRVVEPSHCLDVNTAERCAGLAIYRPEYRGRWSAVFVGLLVYRSASRAVPSRGSSRSPSQAVQFLLPVYLLHDKGDCRGTSNSANTHGEEPYCPSAQPSVGASSRAGTRPRVGQAEGSVRRTRYRSVAPARSSRSAAWRGAPEVTRRCARQVAQVPPTGRAGPGNWSRAGAGDSGRRQRPSPRDMARPSTLRR